MVFGGIFCYLNETFYVFFFQLIFSKISVVILNQTILYSDFISEVSNLFFHFSKFSIFSDLAGSFPVHMKTIIVMVQYDKYISLSLFTYFHFSLHLNRYLNTMIGKSDMHNEIMNFYHILHPR